MSDPGPYRPTYSVWLEVVGVLLTGALLLGGVGYLLYHASGTVSSQTALGPTAGPSHQGGPSPAVRGRQSARPAPSGENIFSSAPRPLLSDRSGPTEAETPFSEGWREQAVPNLTGPSPSGDGAAFRRGTGTGEASSAGRATGASPSPGGPGGAGGSRSFKSGNASQSGGPAWRGEAQKLASRAQALSGQLRQLKRESPGGGRKKNAPSEDASGEASTASASTNDRDVPNPPSVPIDDHLHWLVVAGLLWGIWRLS